MRFEPDDAVPPAIRDGAVLESARDWEPYGIVVEGEATGKCSARDLTLTVAVDLESGNGSSDNGLGAVRFAPDGTPDSTVTLHYNTIVKLAMTATVMGWQSDQWPAALRDQIISRAVGRALAHEIGHVVLRWPHHPTSGLMRNQFGASALADPDRSAFALTETDLARLHIAVSAFLEPAAPADAPLGILAMAVGHSRCSIS